MKTITCHQLISTLDDYVAGEMPFSERQAVEHHLGRCDSCVAYTDSYRRTIEMEKSLSKDDVRAKMPEDLARRISERQRE